MKVSDELIYNGIRIQYIKWNKKRWKIFCNNRFEPEDFTIKVHCDVCGPDKFVPKIIQHKGSLLCCSCLTRMIEMLNTATLEDCGKSREENILLQKAIGK